MVGDDAVGKSDVGVVVDVEVVDERLGDVLVDVAWGAFVEALEIAVHQFEAGEGELCAIADMGDLFQVSSAGM